MSVFEDGGGRPVVTRGWPVLILLTLLPLLFALVLGAMRAASLPFWQVFNLDPDYYYLLNGLRLIEGLAPTDVSHPGTPVQVFVAVVLRLMHGLAPAGAVVDAVLADPEAHLVVVTDALYPLVALALFGLGLAVHRATASVAAAMLAQTAPFLSMIIPKFALHPKPEAFLVIAAALVVVAACAAMKADSPRRAHAVWLGLAVGFAIAVKLQALGLGLVPLFLLDRRRLVLYAATVPLAFLLFTAPAWASAPIWFDWVGRIVLHTGAYGGGEATVIDPARYPRAILGLFGSKLIFTAVLIVTLATLVVAVRRRRFDPPARLLAGLAAAQGATVLIVAKQAAAHYMVPGLMLTGPALALLYVRAGMAMPPSRWHRPVWAALALVLAGVTAGAVRQQTAELAGWTAAAQGFDMTRFAACAKIDFDSASSLPYALLRGDMNAQGRYTPLLERRMPADTYAWFINDHTWWRRSFLWWSHPTGLAAVAASYPCVVLRGNQPGVALPQAQEAMPGFHVDDTCAVGEETVLTIGVTCDGRPLVPLAK